MVIEIRDGSEVPIYLQLRNRIVSGISAGRWSRRAAAHGASAGGGLGVNAMTVSKAYQLLKQGGLHRLRPAQRRRVRAGAAGRNPDPEAGSSCGCWRRRRRPGV